MEASPSPLPPKPPPTYPLVPDKLSDSFSETMARYGHHHMSVSKQALWKDALQKRHHLLANKSYRDQQWLMEVKAERGNEECGLRAILVLQGVSILARLALTPSSSFPREYSHPQVLLGLQHSRAQPAPPKLLMQIVLGGYQEHHSFPTEWKWGAHPSRHDWLFQPMPPTPCSTSPRFYGCIHTSKNCLRKERDKTDPHPWRSSNSSRESHSFKRTESAGKEESS